MGPEVNERLLRFQGTVERIVGPDDGLVSPLIEDDLQHLDFDGIADNHTRMVQASNRIVAARRANLQAREHV